jgi:23S rRNA pseudouridine2605 synthase
VRAHGRVTQAQLDVLKDGIEIEGVRYGPIDATLDKEQGSNVWLSIGLREGKNREVRKILGTLMLDVNRLIRVSFGPFQLLDLKEGEVEHVARRVLADQLGLVLAKELNLIDEPVVEARKPPQPPPHRPERATPRETTRPRKSRDDA